MAVGGYGRGDLCPGSDLDVLLVHDGKNRKEVEQLAPQIWYPLWDAGLKLGHGVRTVKEAVSLAADNLDVATSLLDARLIAGDERLAERPRRPGPCSRGRPSRPGGCGRSGPGSPNATSSPARSPSCSSRT